MATIDMKHPHRTSFEDAKARAKVLLDSFAAKRPELIKTMTWNGDGSRADATGRGFSGHFRVTPEAVEVAIDLALLARPFRSRVEASLTRQLTEEFGP